MAAKRRTAPQERAPEASTPEPAATERVAKRYTPSQKADIVEYAAKHSVLKASKHFGASRFAVYDWQKRVATAARGEGPSPTSGPSQREIEEQRDREILGEWHQHRGLGPSQIKNQLARRSIKVSVATVRHVMQDAGYRPPKVKRTPHDERYESVRPNHRWHLDFVHRYVHRANTFTLILIDDHSRFVVGHGVDDRERSQMAIRTFEEAVARHGKPERVMSDGGSAFWSWRGISKFTSLLTEMAPIASMKRPVLPRTPADACGEQTRPSASDTAGRAIAAVRSVEHGMGRARPQKGSLLETAAPRTSPTRTL